MNENDRYLTDEVIEQITRIVRHGNIAEVKKENTNLVVVEIERRVRTKAAITG